MNLMCIPFTIGWMAITVLSAPKR